MLCFSSPCRPKSWLPPPAKLQAIIPSPAISSPDVAKLAIEYISRKYSLPVDVLSVLTQRPAEYQYLGGTFEAIVVQDTSPYGRVFKTLVDMSSGEVTEDVSGLRQQKQNAKQARYGKLEPRLHEKLETLNESDKLPVIVWLVSADGRSQSQREKVAAEKLAHKYPEAKKAMENSGKPMDVENPELAQQIHKEYVELMRENVDLSGAVISDLKRSACFQGLVKFKLFFVCLPVPLNAKIT